ncbi:abortive infection system antitoxin AbiGi family protein [Mucilaginibacter celer]|uniref:DUF2971 domain-containing protein n=1 Tax=Mucilaginibacter celer TaxID=2305508 RepID=A0A494VSA2_9SPHI|nr:abortive infection system antitoxin AbiGi family protein [Mucilaginibacter celer]AYL94258.1 hypothetical protein HYN43_002645 [Mucilaginibacter celer]
MYTELKKTNTLFHSIREYSNLKNIISDKGFRASYADESIAGYNVKILMISFSNVALLESQSQVNYGNYTIGLTLKWGIKNGLEPVMYTYNESYMGATFFENYFVAAKDSAILKVLQDKGKTDSANFGLVLDLDQISENSYNMLMHLKPYVVTNKSGKEFIAYNDREWRYLCKIENSHSAIFEKSYVHGAYNPLYMEAQSFPKPYTPNPVLLFELDDIKYVVVEHKSQKREIFELLQESFGKDEVMKKNIDGDLDILSRDTMWNNL